MTEIISYEDPDVAAAVRVTLEGDTVWLTQAQMAELFLVRPQNITMHLKNIFHDRELDEKLTCKVFLQVQQEGQRKVQRARKMYNLDVIISVGYRVNSRRGVRFRQWASSVLKDHLLKGYSLNRQRLGERGVEDARPEYGARWPDRPSRRSGCAGPRPRRRRKSCRRRCSECWRYTIRRGKKNPEALKSDDVDFSF